MFCIKSLSAIAAILSLVTTSLALDAAAKSNVAVYYGQGASQPDLATFCSSTSIDIIQLAFVYVFPQQGNGYPGTNFGNQCWGGSYVFSGPDGDPSKDSLQSECPTLAADILTCQAAGKTVLLSLGGQAGTYQLTGEDNGFKFAEFLWGAFGPRTDVWVDANLPRPFDIMNSDGSFSQEVVVDGFDFDIEAPSTDDSAGYIELLETLRLLFITDESKSYYLSAAPQCIVPDANMATMITAVAFDFVWVQFYNTPQCSARAWLDAIQAGDETSPFTYDSWSDFLTTGKSVNAKLFIGLVGSDVGTDYYMNPEETGFLLETFYDYENFGGVMIWEATSALYNDDGIYYDTCKTILNELAPTPVSSSTVTVVATSQSTSIASTSSIITTSSVSSSTSSGAATTTLIPSSGSDSSSTTQILSPTLTPIAGISSSSGNATSKSFTFPIGASTTPISPPLGTGGSSAPFPIGAGASSFSILPTGGNSAPLPIGTGSSVIPVGVSSASSIINSTSNVSVTPFFTGATTSTFPHGTGGTLPVGSSSAEVIESLPPPIPVPSVSGVTPESGLVPSSLTTSSFPQYTASKNWNATTLAIVPSTVLSPFPSESTVLITKTYTITSCAATVTDCPARIGSVTTAISASIITILPSGTESTSELAPSAGASTSETTSVAALLPFPTETTSTVLITKTYTVTSCAPTITDCPARIGSVTTEVITSVVTVPCTETAQTGGSGSTPSGVTAVPGIESSLAANPSSPSASGTVTETAIETVIPISLPTTTNSSSNSESSAVSPISDIIKVITSTQTVIPIPQSTLPASASASAPSLASETDKQEIGTTTVTPTLTSVTQTVTIGFNPTAVGGASPLTTSTSTGFNLVFGNSTVVGVATGVSSGFVQGITVTSVPVGGSISTPAPIFTGGAGKSMKMGWGGLVVSVAAVFFCLVL